MACHTLGRGETELASGTHGLREGERKRKERKRRKPQYSDTRQPGETGVTWITRPTSVPLCPGHVSGTMTLYAVSVQSMAHANGAKVGRARKGATVYADSFRHVIYNTLRTSNRLIKYILYKYISYCTHCPLVQPLRPHTPRSSRGVPGRNAMPALLAPDVPHLSLHTGGLREDGQEFASVKLKLWKD